MTNRFSPRKFGILTIAMLIFVTGCSGLPMRLKSTADQSMHFLNAEMSTAIEGFNHIHPLLKDNHQISEEKWCLTYELGPEFSFSSLWEKQVQDWVQVELRPYVENWDWAR
jgi:hypothetical protein